jgi:hypothetical protein
VESRTAANSYDACVTMPLQCDHDVSAGRGHDACAGRGQMPLQDAAAGKPVILAKARIQFLIKKRFALHSDWKKVVRSAHVQNWILAFARMTDFDEPYDGAARHA